MSLETSRPTTQRWAYPMLLAVMVVGLGTSGAPAPLYGIYAAKWGFAPLTTTIVFAVYAAAALVA
ncbi:MAG: MFS transporter, partial [Actinomycetales bacterium]